MANVAPRGFWEFQCSTVTIMMKAVGFSDRQCRSAIKGRKLIPFGPEIPLLEIDPYRYKCRKICIQGLLR